MTDRTDIRLLSSEELKNAVAELGEKPFRSRQLEDWIWTHGAGSFDEMTNLSKSFRGLLGERFELSRIRLAEQQVSRDGTIKCAFDVGVNKVVEGVLIPTTKRMTACISSQVGCSLACKFCATGKLKLLKNLTQEKSMIKWRSFEVWLMSITTNRFPILCTWEWESRC